MGQSRGKPRTRSYTKQVDENQTQEMAITTKKYGEKLVWARENSNVAKKEAYTSLSKVNKIVEKQSQKIVLSKELRTKKKQKISKRPRTPRAANEDGEDEDYRPCSDNDEEKSDDSYYADTELSTDDDELIVMSDKVRKVRSRIKKELMRCKRINQHLSIRLQDQQKLLLCKKFKSIQATTVSIIVAQKDNNSRGRMNQIL